MKCEKYVIVAEGGTTYGVYEADSFGGFIGRLEINGDDDDEIIDAAKNELCITGNFEVR